MTALSGRFREVRVTLEHEPLREQFPKDWLEARMTGNVLTFVDARYSCDRLGERIRSVVGGVRAIDAEPMPLRAIFITLARSARESCIR